MAPRAWSANKCVARTAATSQRARTHVRATNGKQLPGHALDCAHEEAGQPRRRIVGRAFPLGSRDVVLHGASSGSQ
eukprot:11160695-Lingulodinium_polyedra.AAC.1